MARSAAIFLILVAALSAGAVFAQTVMPVRAIRGQTVLQAEDLALSEDEVPGALTSIEEAAGQETRTTLYPGRAILASQVGAPALVERNAVVRLSYASGALHIVTEGRALDRAAAGEPVRVMNLASKQTVTGMVAADGSVEVGQ